MLVPKQIERGSNQHATEPAMVVRLTHSNHPILAKPCLQRQHQASGGVYDMKVSLRRLFFFVAFNLAY
jgi:hypothetical protein